MPGGGRQYPLKATTTRSPIFIFTLALLALSLLYFIFSSHYSQAPAPLAIHPSQNPTFLNPTVDYSFLVSLEKFLTTKSPPPPKPDDTDLHYDVNHLDDSIWIAETRRLYDHPSPPLRVYVYQMPSKFTYDLLWLFRSTYTDTFNLTSNGSPVHRLIEQHSIDYWLWADLIAPQSERLLKNAVLRVHRQEEADLFYIPFFTTISFFLLEKQQCKALYRVKL